MIWAFFWIGTAILTDNMDYLYLSVIPILVGSLSSGFLIVYRSLGSWK